MSTLFGEPPGLLVLADLVRDCSVSGVARRVLLLRTDLLPPKLSRPHHVRLAQEALEPLLRAERARSYVLAHGRMALSWRGDAAAPLRKALEALEHLLHDAPLEAPTVSELARVFELPLDGAALLAVAASAGRHQAEVAEAAPPALPAPPRLLPPLSSAMLDAVEIRLANANVARFARRRLVYRLGLNEVTPAWESRLLSVRALMQELTPAHDAFADPWLLRRLSRMVDRRLMALLSSGPELRVAGPFSLGLNVGSVLSPEFLKFDGALPPGLRGQTLLELRPADVMADLAAYRFAGAFVRARGYKVVLRGIVPVLLELLDLQALEADFLELRWSPNLVGLDAARLQVGTARWVLSRADDPEALRWGRSMGIGLFQGAAVQGAGIQGAAGQAAPRTAA